MAAGGSKMVVYAAIAGNLAIAVTKFAAARRTPARHPNNSHVATTFSRSTSQTSRRSLEFSPFTDSPVSTYFAVRLTAWIVPTFLPSLRAVPLLGHSSWLSAWPET